MTLLKTKGWVPLRESPSSFPHCLLIAPARVLVVLDFGLSELMERPFTGWNSGRIGVLKGGEPREDAETNPTLLWRTRKCTEASPCPALQKFMLSFL